MYQVSVRRCGSLSSNRGSSLILIAIPIVGVKWFTNRTDEFY
jgi:hypothetical protein